MRSSLFGLGVDLVRVSRIQQLLVSQRGERFVAKAFHPEEAARAATMEPQRRAEFLAGRWAVKEAAVKAVGERLLFPQVTVGNTRPQTLQLHGEAQELFSQRGLKQALVSLSHDGDYAIAQVIVE